MRLHCKALSESVLVSFTSAPDMINSLDAGIVAGAADSIVSLWKTCSSLPLAANLKEACSTFVIPVAGLLKFHQARAKLDAYTPVNNVVQDASASVGLLESCFKSWSSPRTTLATPKMPDDPTFHDAARMVVEMTLTKLNDHLPHIRQNCENGLRGCLAVITAHVYTFKQASPDEPFCW